ncbi:MAG: hypothetical protein ACYC05_15320 [Sulfuricella sp.]
MKHPTIPRTTRAIAATLAGSLLMLQPAMASLPDMHIFSNAEEISDEELSGMRGRYVDSGQVMYFGVEMYTRWQATDTMANNARTNLMVTPDGTGYRATITFTTWEDPSNSPAPTPGGGTISISGGIGNVSGVGQSIHIGGNGNAIRNDVNMNVDLNAAEGPPAGGESLGQGSHHYGSTTVTVGGNSLSMAVNLGGQSQVLQQIKGGQGFLQSAHIGGDLNRVHNVITVNAGLNGASGLQAHGLQSSMQMLRGLPGSF